MFVFLIGMIFIQMVMVAAVSSTSSFRRDPENPAIKPPPAFAGMEIMTTQTLIRFLTAR
jgi:hypothetical protein